MRFKIPKKLLISRSDGLRPNSDGLHLIASLKEIKKFHLSLIKSVEEVHLRPGDRARTDALSGGHREHLR